MDIAGGGESWKRGVRLEAARCDEIYIQQTTDEVVPRVSLGVGPPGSN